MDRYSQLLRSSVQNSSKFWTSVTISDFMAFVLQIPAKKILDLWQDLKASTTKCIRSELKVWLKVPKHTENPCEKDFWNSHQIE